MSQSSGIKDTDGFFNGEWVRKASDAEVELEQGHQEGHLLIWYQLDLSSAKPLQENHVRNAVNHLYRKVPSLSLCYGTHEGEAWFRRATNPDIDFKVLHGLRLEEVREYLRNHHYSSHTGPLFCARLVRESPNIMEDAINLEPSLPHKCHILFGLHHGTTDGTSNMHIMGYFISLLNDVISGKPIDKEPLGAFVSNEETCRLIMKKKLLLEADPELKQKIDSERQFKRENIPLVIRGFPVSNDRKSTKSIIRILDESTTAKFIQRCRQEKITVNSVFTSIMNMAIVDVLMEHGIHQECYVVQNFHIMNLRRYWEPKPFKPLGMHMAYPLIMLTKTPKDVRGQFWDYCKNLGETLKDAIVSGKLLSDMAYNLLPSENKFHSGEDSHTGDGYKSDFITSNMGDITSMVTVGGDHVRITNVIRGTTFHKTEYPVLLNCHTFRGVFTMVFEYNRAALQRAVAEKISSQIFKCLLELVE